MNHPAAATTHMDVTTSFCHFWKFGRESGHHALQGSLFFFRGEGKRVLKCEKLFPVELGESNSTFCPPCGTSSREISPAALCSNNASLFPSVFVKDKGNNLSSSSSSSSLRVSHTSFSLAESPWLQHQRVVVMQLIVTSALFMSCTCPVPAYSESNTIKMQAFVAGPGVTNINNAAAK